MNSWMTPTRQRLARQYVHDMINSFVEDPQGADYHGSFEPPYISFYSPDIEGLLEKACYEDKYLNAHKDLAEFNDFDPHIYDIEGHRVRTLKGMIDISIDGDTFDRIECDRWGATTSPRERFTPPRWRRLGEAKDTKTNKFHVRLSPK